MAFNAQFFQLNPQSSLADDMSSGYKAGYEMREAERKKALQKTYSDMLTSAGTLPTEFIQEAAKKGIGMEGLEKYFQNLKDNVGTAKQVAEDSSMLEMLGRTPDVGREWNGKPKEQQITITSGAEIKKEDPDMWGQLNPKWSANPVKPSDSISAAPMSDKVVEDEYNRHSGSIATLPPLPETTDPTITVTEPKEYSAVEEMLRRSGKNPIDGLTTTGTSTTGFSSDLTKWEPKDNGSNEYRQFATALQNELSANNFKSAEDYLTTVGKTVYEQNLYVPNPMAMYTKDGKIDRAAYGAEIAKQKQSQIVAKAKAEEAILKARDGLIAKAKEYGVQTIGSEVEKDRQEAHEADYAGRRAGGYQFRPVTQAEATKGRDLVSSYFDIRDGIRRGGFEGAYAAALAKAKADGSVNSDAIVGNLIAMGAVPSAQSVYVKSLMNQNGTVGADAWNQIKAVIGDVLFAESGATKKWANDALKNIAETAKLYGFKIDITPDKEDKKTEDKTAPAPKKTSAADVIGGSPEAKTNYKGKDSKGRPKL